MTTTRDEQEAQRHRGPIRRFSLCLCVSCSVLVVPCLLLMTALVPAPAVGQTRNSGAENVAVEPIECWWRTTSNAIRVGERFDIVLTCAVLETSATTVVPDRSRLDPTVLQLPPFEVTGGSQAADLRTPSRRFFQYEYTLRYIGEDFGRDIALPALSVAYRVQSRVDPNAAAIESRDRQYNLPAHTIRITSLVPFNARDIRDRPPDTFRGIEQRRFRANILRIVAITLMSLAGAMAVWALIRYFTRRRSTAARAVRHASDGAILRLAAHELDEVTRGKQVEGWTPALAARALAALRIVGAYAVSGHATQVACAPDVEPTEGQLLVRPAFGGKRALVSGTVTPLTVEREMRRREMLNGHRTGPLPDLHAALVAFTTVAYARPASPETAAGYAVDAADLDDAMASAARAAREVQRENRWIARRLQALQRSAANLRQRAWAR